MSPQEFTKAVTDALEMVAAVAAEHPELALAPAVDLLELVVAELPPIGASDLDPADRAAADKEAADREAAKFGKP
jgi:hypothetical protein